jgi:hypothetical protein
MLDGRRPSLSHCLTAMLAALSSFNKTRELDWSPLLAMDSNAKKLGSEQKLTLLALIDKVCSPIPSTVTDRLIELHSTDILLSILLYKPLFISEHQAVTILNEVYQKPEDFENLHCFVLACTTFDKALLTKAIRSNLDLTKSMEILKDLSDRLDLANQYGPEAVQVGDISSLIFLMSCIIDGKILEIKLSTDSTDLLHQVKKTTDKLVKCWKFQLKHSS